MQAYADVKKRVQGAPSSGKVAVVVTDIESYSGELKQLNGPLQLGHYLLYSSPAVYSAVCLKNYSSLHLSPLKVTVTLFLHAAELMVAMPLVMGRSMSHHNNVIRKAAWTHFGFVIGQEGDSFILVFQDPLDAVAFCLQVRILYAAAPLLSSSRLGQN